MYIKLQYNNLAVYKLHLQQVIFEIGIFMSFALAFPSIDSKKYAMQYGHKTTSFHS